MFCLRLPGWQPFISARRHLPFGFGSPRGILLPNLDFSLAGFTSFHPERFRSGFVTVAHYGSASWDRSFRVGLRRQLSLPGLIDSAGTNTTGITACASMDFPLTYDEASDCPNVHKCVTCCSGSVRRSFLPDATAASEYPHSRHPALPV